jgi:lactoylglutathione lyase
MTCEAVSLNLVVIRSADLERSARFFASLGVELAREIHGSGPEHLAGRVGPVVLEVYPADGAGTMTTVRLGFCVQSIAKVLASLAKEGGVVLSPPTDSPWGLRAVVVDPDGHRIELTEAAAKN